MEEQQKTQHLAFEKNGKHLQPSLPIYSNSLANNSDRSDNDLDLRSLLTVMRRRAITIGSVAIAIAVGIGCWTLSREPKYEGTFKLLVEPVTTENKLDELTQIPGISNINLQQQGLDYDTQVQVLISPELMEPIIARLAQRYPDIDYKSMLEDLAIERFEATKILEVSYRATQPEQIQFVLEQLAKEYLKYSLAERQTTLRQGIQFVDAQLPEMRSRVNSLQRELQVFRQQYNFIDPEVKAEQLAKQVDEIELQRLDTAKELAETRALYANFQTQSGAALADSPEFYTATSSQERTDTPQALKEAPVYQKLVGQLRDIESQIGADSTRFQDDSPTMIALRQKRENLLPVLRIEAQRILGNKLVELSTTISKLEVRLAQIVQAENKIDRQIEQLPTLARQYTDLQRELKVATESLNRFLEKRESLQIENAQNEIPWQIIAAPKVDDEDPVSPKIARNLILGAIAGIMAGIGAALLTERLDNVFHSPEDLKELTKLPLLGAIPFNKGLKQLTPLAQAKVEKKVDGYKLVLPNINSQQNESYFPFIEAFRSLHTNINFLGSDTPIRSLVVSSAEKGDGKSTVAIQLAQAAASMGQRVLIVDADMRLPQVHLRLNLPNEQGLSNIISTNLPIYEVIQRSPISDNLFAITSGQIPPDPIKLLSSKKMLNIMAEIRQEFDLVVYDTPPILGLADSSIIAKHTDGIVVVVRLAKTDRSVVKQALDGLRLSRANVLGTVVNGVKKHSSSAYNYYYYKGKTPHANSN
ncbi:GumC family protein [Aliterella atlantica]|uniref:non-specific protein-tyrosine kinase n=1 Tax=Aliterella atlantica CENA595 TaxID=1618023 RepID=A0A0D8ZSX1_9CYAN|nr:polysaccharide biosynthesis tyrosine autokinase [Aliterella atlantica]KJH71835.1 protein tyrosine kinase [Aliterella atlantica CENA595]